MQSAQKLCSKQSSGAGSLSIVSSALMGGVVTMGLLMWGMENIFVLIMGGMNLLMVQHTLMELKGFGDFSKFVCPGFAVWSNLLFICILKNVSLGSIIEIKTLTGGVDIEKLCFSKVVGDQPLSGSFGDLLHNLTAVFQPVETLPGHINYMVSGS